MRAWLVCEMEEAFLAHQKALLGYVYKRVKDKHIAQDIVQEVYLKALEKQTTLRSPERLVGWLYTIAAHAIVDFYRAKSPALPLCDDHAQPQVRKESLEELSACVEPLLALLPKHHALALRLYELEGLSQNAIAKELNLSLSATKSRILRGRKQLKERLLACCEIEYVRGKVAGFTPRKDCDSTCAC